jgi:hypothetical protein
MPKQTAVEWLIDNLHYLHSTKWDDILEKAKEMERQQIINAVDGYPTNLRHLDGPDYYEQAYGGKDA